MSGSSKYECTFCKCKETFSSLRLFEAHIGTHSENNQTIQMDQSSIDESEHASKNNDGIDAVETKVEVQIEPTVEDCEEEDFDILSDDTESCIQGLLKLSESDIDGLKSPSNTTISQSSESLLSPSTEPVSKDETNDQTQCNKNIKASTPSNGISAQVISISDITPKNANKNNQLKVQNLRTRNISMKPNPTLIPMMSDRIIPMTMQSPRHVKNNNNMIRVNHMNQVSMNQFGSNRPQVQIAQKRMQAVKSAPTQSSSVANRMSRKRKLSEMNSDELAHLYMRYQDRVISMKEKLETAEKQVIAVRQLYKKRLRLSAQSKNSQFRK